MSDKLIRWTRSDAQKLSRAIRRYNNIVDKLDESNLSKIVYSDFKSEIMTRKELKRQLEKLDRLTPENAGTYTEDELKRELALAERRLKRELKQKDKGEYMGNIDYQYIEGELKNIRKIDDLPENFRKKKIDRVRQLASHDYNMKQAKSYKAWYMQSLEENYAGFKGYNRLVNKLNKIKNPTTFYNQIKEHLNESDIFLIRYTLANQELFNRILRAWGEDEEEESEIYE